MSVASEVFTTLVDGAATPRSRKLAAHVANRSEQLFINAADDLPHAQAEVERLEMALEERRERYESDVARRKELHEKLLDLEISYELDDVDNAEEQAEIKTQLDQLDTSIHSFSYMEASHLERIEMAKAAVAELDRRIKRAEVDRLLAAERPAAADLFNAYQEFMEKYVTLQRLLDRKHKLQSELRLSHDGAQYLPKLTVGSGMELEKRMPQLLDELKQSLWGNN